MSLEIEKTLVAVKDFLEENLKTYVEQVNSLVIDSVMIEDMKEIKVATFDVLDEELKLPRINIFAERLDITELTTGMDEIEENVKILVAIKTQDNLILKMLRTVEAIKACLNSDNTLSGQIEYITIKSVQVFLPLTTKIIAEITCKTKRLIERSL